MSIQNHMEKASIPWDSKDFGGTDKDVPFQWLYGYNWNWFGLLVYWADGYEFQPSAQ